MNKTSSFVSYSSYFIENEKFKQDISLCLPKIKLYTLKTRSAETS